MTSRWLGLFVAALILGWLILGAVPAAAWAAGNDPSAEPGGSVSRTPLDLVRAYVSHGLPQTALQYIDSLVDEEADLAARTGPDAILARDLYVEKVKILRTLGRHQEAVQVIQEAGRLPLSPVDRAPLTLIAATVEQVLGRQDQAGELYFQAWRDTDQPWAEGVARRGLLLLWKGGQGTLPILDWVQAAREQGLPQVKALTLTGALHEAAGDLERARAAWEERIDLAPWDDETYLRLSQFLRTRGEFGACAELAKRRWQALAGTRQRYEVLAEVLNAWRDAGTLDLQVAACEADPAVEAIRPALLGAYYGDLLQDPERAQPWFLRALENDPDDAPAFMRAMEYFRTREQWQPAVDLMLGLGRAGCSDPWLYHEAGATTVNLLVRLRGVDGAVQELEAHVRGHAQDRVGRWALLKIYSVAVADDERHEVVARELIALSPDDKDPYNHLIGYLRDRGAHEEALQLMRDAAARFPDQTPSILSAQVEASLRAGQPAQALALLHEFRRVRTPPYPLEFLAVAEYVVGAAGEDEDRAWIARQLDQHFERVKDLALHYHELAMVAQRLGDKPAARVALRRAREVLPEDKDWPEFLRQALKDLEAWASTP